MRTTDEIFNDMLIKKQSYPALDSLNSTSKVAIWRNLLWVFAFAIYLHESIFVSHKNEVNNLIDNEKPHSPLWYRNKVLDFQYGFTLLPQSDIFNNVGHSEDQILASKIIKNAAVEEPLTESVIIIKVATGENGNWTPISEDQLTALDYYISRFRDAGVAYRLINFLPDKLILDLKIKRDPNVIDQDGFSILNSKNVVKEALNTFKTNLPFNGELILNNLVDALQAIEGVINPTLNFAKSAWIDGTTGTYGDYQSIYISQIPVSGYFAIDWENSNIEYVV